MSMSTTPTKTGEATPQSITATQPTAENRSFQQKDAAPKSLINPEKSAIAPDKSVVVRTKSMHGSTPENEIPKGRLTCSLICAALAAGLGSSFIFGYNIGVINAAGDAIKRWICSVEGLYLETNENQTNSSNMTDSEFVKALGADQTEKLSIIWSWVVGIFPLGGMFGGLCTGLVADRFGRKGGMLLNNILTFVAAGCMALSKPAGHYALLILGRFLIGVNAGLNSGLAPMYLTEISPINYRGLLGSVNQLMVTISILVSNVLGLPSLLGTSVLWPYLLLFTIVPSIYQLISMPFCPESPKHLSITKGQRDLARNALVKLRGTNDVEAELVKMQEEADALKNIPKITFGDLFKGVVMRRALLIAVVMMFSQQLSGINAAMFYSTQIFTTDAKLTPDEATGATMGMMVVNVLMTVVSTVLVDRCGRRTLQLIGLVGMWISTILLVISLHLSAKEVTWAGYLSIAFVIAFVIAFATGPGSIPWFYVSECFEQAARGKANSIAVGVNWFAAFLVGLSFPPTQVALKEFSFLIFTFFLTLFFFFTLKFVPETKDKTVKEVLASLGNKEN